MNKYLKALLLVTGYALIILGGLKFLSASFSVLNSEETAYNIGYIAGSFSLAILLLFFGLKIVKKTNNN